MFTTDMTQQISLNYSNTNIMMSSTTADN